jgi:azurin
MTTLVVDIVRRAAVRLRLHGGGNGLRHPHRTAVPAMAQPLIAVLACGLLLVACGGPSATAAAGSQVIVEMTDYKVVTNVPSVKAGTIKIGVRNLASMEHNFEVIKTEMAADQLPIDPASAKAVDVGKVGEIAKIPGGTSAAVTLDLAPGKYVFICNIAGHYELGMHTAFLVEP